LAERAKIEASDLDRTDTLLNKSTIPAPAKVPPVSGQPDVDSSSDQADQLTVSSLSTGSNGAGLATIANKKPAPRDLVIESSISFLSEINTCRQLVVEGSAEVKLGRCDEIMIGETGVLKGQIFAETVDVHGRMEGDITVRKRLLIRSNGRVCGTVTYGEIEIEKGGQMIGTATVRDRAPLSES
jgi:cytoskeletal protein CcmA (bactofilin family)